LTIPSDPAEFRAWRDATLYRLAMRMSRTERTTTLERLQAKGYAHVTLTDTTLMANLDNDGTSITALARKAGITRQAASQQVLQLEKEGYLRRDPDPRDARAVLVFRTDLGHRLLDDAVRIVADLEHDYTRILGADDMATLKALLTRLLAEIDPDGLLGPD
jgi:DNA-binding MarR family transcriptional regulator